MVRGERRPISTRCAVSVAGRSETGGEGAGLDVLAFGAHPDDVELGCGALLALFAQRGHAVGVCHLTRGEAGTRGTADERRAEALEAASCLGLASVEFLDCGDGALRHGEAEEESVIEVLRRSRPQLVLAPPPRDRHPDHERAHRLVFDAAFYAGLVKRASHLGPPHRPPTIFWYMLHQTFEPSLLVDVSSSWKTKMAALACYRSQFAGNGSEPPSESAAMGRGDGYELGESVPFEAQVSREREQGSADQRRTHISSTSFWSAIEGRGRHYGQQIGVEFAEPLACRLPVAMHDPLWLLAAGRP